MDNNRDKYFLFENDVSSGFSSDRSFLDELRSASASPLSAHSSFSHDQKNSPIFSLIDGYGKSLDYFAPKSSWHPNQSTGRRRSSSLNSLEFLTMATSGVTLRDHSPLSSSPSKTLWIGNVDPSISEKELRDLFSTFGPIESLKVLPVKECAFVNYVRLEDSKMAKEKLQGHALGKMIMRIGYGKHEIIHRSSSFDTLNPSRALWVGNVNPSMSLEELNAEFSKFGLIESSRILEGKSCAFVNFFQTVDAINAKKELSGKTLKNSVIKVGFAKATARKTENHSPLKENVSEDLDFFHEQSFSYKTLCSKCHVRLAEIEISPCGHDICHECSTKLKREGKLLIDTETVCLVCSQNVSRYIFVDDNEDFLQPIPPLPAPSKIVSDQSKLKDIKRRLETSVSLREIENLLMDLLPQAVDLSFDHIGNTIVQKMIEKGNDYFRLKLMEVLSPYLASLGIHKNGTWVVQKLIDFAKTSDQRSCIASSIRPYLVALLHDQYGNYVVQCCLLFGAMNQFMVDGFCLRLMEISRNRFGARAMKSCLESPHMTASQKKAIISHLLEKSLALVHDQNGVILVQWILESDLPGRFTLLAKQLRGHIPSLTLHKFGSAVVAKLIQSSEPTACEIIAEELLNEKILNTLTSDPVSASILMKCISICHSKRLILVAMLKPILMSIPASLRAPHHSKLLEEISRYQIDPNSPKIEAFVSSPSSIPIHRSYITESKNSVPNDDFYGSSSFYSGNLFYPNPFISKKTQDVWSDGKYRHF